MDSTVHAMDTALRAHRLVAVIRAATPGAAYDAARTVVGNGLPIVEITFTVPDAPAVMLRMAGEPGAIVGAGTVLTAEQARQAVAAGARFLIAPNTSAEVAAVAHDAGVFWCPGAYTTGEILAARALGAHLIKVYPVGVAGGPDYIKVIRDPLPDVPLLAAGGTNLRNVPDFLAAGCVACGLGAALADPALALAGDLAEIARRTQAFVAAAAPFQDRTA
jgi:2-dehydro-3-deoxyphosphogluconate aldolase/(4S)-4-hydroxy-2-oxoglutarate aldolase